MLLLIFNSFLVLMLLRIAGRYSVTFGPSQSDINTRTSNGASSGSLSIDERALYLALAVNIDFDYFSRHSNSGSGVFFPFSDGDVRKLLFPRNAMIRSLITTFNSLTRSCFIFNPATVTFRCRQIPVTVGFEIPDEFKQYSHPTFLEVSGEITAGPATSSEFSQIVKRRCMD